MSETGLSYQAFFLILHWRDQIDALYECCNTFYQRNGDDAKTVSCPKPNLLR